MSSLLEEFGLSSSVKQEVLQSVWGGDAEDANTASPGVALRKWLSLLPAELSQQIDAALKQEQPFMPPECTPELMAEMNARIPSMKQTEIIYRCVNFAMEAGDYLMAAALLFVVDRACYRFGLSGALLHAVDEVLRVSPAAPIAPQVTLRKARVMKDNGNMHGAMRILDAVINREICWNYRDETQYQNVRAVCVEIKGQILHNLGLWKDAVPLLLEAFCAFGVLSDHKGISSSLGLLCRCLNKLGSQDYEELRSSHPDIFLEAHPCYEAYNKGLEAARSVEHLGGTLYVAKHQLVADESLLMYLIQQQAVSRELKWFQTILEEMKKSMSGHRSVSFLHSVEAFFEFVRAVFLISLTLTFSPVSQDTEAAQLLEKLSIQLYGFMCLRPGAYGDGKQSAFLNQNKYSVRLMNCALGLLGLPPLDGSGTIERLEEDQSWDEVVAAQGHQVSRSNDSSASRTAPSLSGDSNTSTNQTGSSCLSESIGSFSNGGDLSNAKISDKSATFPAISPHRFWQQTEKISHQKTYRKFVGLAADREDLLSATCPAVLLETDLGIIEESPADIDSLVPSAAMSASVSSSIKDEKSSTSQTGHLSVCYSSSNQSSWGVLPFESSSSPSGQASRACSGTGTSGGSALIDHDASTKSSSGSGAGTSGGSALVNCDASTKSSLGSGAGMSRGSGHVDQDASTKSSSGSGAGMSGRSGHVDQDASTKSSSGSGTGTSGGSALVDCDASTKSTSSGSEIVSHLGEKLQPLVDLSTPTACSLLSGLGLGDSVDTNDSAEYLASWTPAEDKSVHRATLWTYNPVAGQWSAQSTLAHLGAKLQTDKEGKFREAFHVSFLHQDEPLGRYVGKRYKQRRNPHVYMQDVVCQILAGYYVTRFNQALQKFSEDLLQVQFLSAAHLQLCNERGEVFDWINVEPFLHGSFLKLTNNLKFVSQDQKDQLGVEVATALSHFSYVETGGTLMVVDLQGWMPSDGKGVVFLTDPVFHTRNMKKFSAMDHQEQGMKAFWEEQHPRCNRICQFLGLDKSRPDSARV